jgi:hypothetical protein
VSQVLPMLHDLVGTGSGGAFRLQALLPVALARLLVLFVALGAHCLVDLTVS